MTEKVKLYHLFASVVISITVSSCASVFPKTESVAQDTASDDNTGQFNDLVPQDVVSILKQVNELSPLSTTLGIANNSWLAGDFADALRDELESAGYAIRSVGSSPETLPLSYSITENARGVPTGWNGQSQTVIVTAGDIAVRRAYLISNEGAISPLGKMQVKGVDQGTLTMKKDVFAASAEGSSEQEEIPVKPAPTVAPFDDAREELAQSTLDTESFPEKSAADAAPPAFQQPEPQATKPSTEVINLPEEITLLDSIAPSVPYAESQSQALLAITLDRSTENIMDLQQSNFENLFADMAFVNEKILMFGSDSMRLGDVNKNSLQELIKSFESESDIFSLVGCALGHTDFTGGQENLALGRAKRVREELIYAGIPENSIVEEGCWSAESYDERMPRSGVVVTLKRKVA